MCKVCGDRRELFRFGMEEREPGKWYLRLDLGQRFHGRGVYCHARAKCLFAPNFAESLFRSLLKRGKAKLEGITSSETFVAIVEREKVELEEASQKKRIGSSRLGVRLRLVDELLKEQRVKQDKRSAAPRKKIRI